MAYDQAMVDRFHKAACKYGEITQRKMMGGICFMYQGNMLGGCSGQSVEDKNFMFRVGKDNEAEALKRAGARPVILGERRMGGMVFVDERTCNEKAIREWMALVFEFVGSLPAKG